MPIRHGAKLTKSYSKAPRRLRFATIEKQTPRELCLEGLSSRCKQGLTDPLQEIIVMTTHTQQTTPTRTIKQPGPDHPIEIARNSRRIVVTVAGRVVADTRRAFTLKEANYPAVQYIPRDDVDMSLLERSDHTTYCPYK